MPSDIELYDDAWIFLIEGSNSVGDYFLRRKLVDTGIVQQWNKLLIDRQRRISDFGARYVHLVAPEKINIYPDKVTDDVSVGHSPSAQIENGLSEDILREVWVNPVNYLRKQKEKYLVYSKTDSHWNFYGAYCAYQLLQSKLGEVCSPYIINKEKQRRWTTMDLGGKYEPPLQEKVYFYTLGDSVERFRCNPIVDHKEKNAKLNEIGLHVGSYVSFTNSAPVVDKTVLIFGDSFSEYRGHLLTGLMAESYSTVHFVWSSSLDYRLIEEIQPDIVVSELAERFMPLRVPMDNFDLHNYEIEVLAKAS